jgi:predicted nucleic acid-binding protein
VTLVDTNVILDVMRNDTQWGQWSLLELKAARSAGPLLINDVIYAELSVRFETIDELDSAVTGFGFSVKPIPRSALFLAGKAFRQYRLRGGVRTGVLPDFFIGAQAAEQGYTLLTRDASRYRTYFPKLRLIAPFA